VRVRCEPRARKQARTRLSILNAGVTANPENLLPTFSRHFERCAKC
jgi:hypothetical protein